MIILRIGVDSAGRSRPVVEQIIDRTFFEGPRQLGREFARPTGRRDVGLAGPVGADGVVQVVGDIPVRQHKDSFFAQRAQRPSDCQMMLRTPDRSLRRALRGSCRNRRSSPDFQPY